MRTKIEGNLFMVSAVLVLASNFAITQACSASKPSKPTQCPEHDCNNGKQCYTHAQQCDGTKNCDDNTDEDVGHCGNPLVVKGLIKTDYLTVFCHSSFRLKTNFVHSQIKAGFQLGKTLPVLVFPVKSIQSMTYASR